MNNRLREQCVLDGFGFISNGNFVDFLNRLILSKFSEHSWLYTDKHLKGLYGNIGVLISDNSLSSEIASDIVILVLHLQTGIHVTLKIMTKILLIQD